MSQNSSNLIHDNNDTTSSIQQPASNGSNSNDTPKDKLMNSITRITQAVNSYKKINTDILDLIKKIPKGVISEDKLEEVFRNLKELEQSVNEANQEANTAKGELEKNVNVDQSGAGIFWKSPPKKPCPPRHKTHKHKKHHKKNSKSKRHHTRH
tara:strand:- start:230 stop:688 length:459 start_codon:yes stop_codon:yes gene_type:complete